MAQAEKLKSWLYVSLFEGDRPSGMNGHATVPFTVPSRVLQSQYSINYARG